MKDVNISRGVILHESKERKTRKKVTMRFYHQQTIVDTYPEYFKRPEQSYAFWNRVRTESQSLAE